MPYKRKDSEFWWITFTAADGRRVRRSAETRNKAEASALEQKLRADTWKEREWGVLAPRSYEEVVVPYLQNAAQHQRSYNTTVDRFKNLTPFFAGKTMNTLKGLDISDYTRHRLGEGASEATINRELSALSAAINHANVEFEWNLPNPTKGRKLKEPEGRDRWLTKAELAALVRQASTQRHGDLLADFILLAVNTGCRKEEMLGLEWRRVDFANRLIHLAGEQTKSGKRRSVPINAGAMEALRGRAAFRAEHCPASPWVFARATGERAKSVRTGFAKACLEAGIDDFDIHDLRHTCASWMVSAGVPLADVKEVLGHSSIAMTERYAHLAPGRIADAVRALDGVRDGELSRFGHGAAVTPLKVAGGKGQKTQ